MNGHPGAGLRAPRWRFYDGYRSARLPANLLQAQRDYFGAHTYERVGQAARPVLPHQLDRPRRHDVGVDLHGVTGTGTALSYALQALGKNAPERSTRNGQAVPSFL